MLVYLIIINALAFSLMLADKYKAKKNLWRIRETTLFGVAMLGGSLGCLVGMYSAHHKTKHPKFTMGVPAILAVQIMLLILLYR